MKHSLQRRAGRKRQMKLGTTVILMVSAVLFSVLLVVHLIYFSQISHMTRDALADKALAVARTLADSPEIRQRMKQKPTESGIQAIAEAVRKRNDMLFIVITDMKSIRYSHPEAQRIGQPFKGDDILLALQGHENVAINRGFLAKALRVFTPIYDDNHQQIGVVAIGLELSRDRLLLINTVPVRSNGKIIGAISTFRDKTEVRQLMQRLDGMVNYADALRERSHEFMNKLHVILGLLHLKSYKQLEDYIIKTANNYQEEIGSLLGKIKSPVIAGFLLSKINRTSDLGHSLVISNESRLPDSRNEDQITVLITILGNLIENALEALGQQPGGEISVSLHYRHGWLHCEVNDDGPGIDPERIEQIFDKGVSSKGTERGVGLAIVKQQVESIGGNITVESEPGIFTQFFVQIPWDGERTSI